MPANFKRTDTSPSANPAPNTVTSSQELKWVKQLPLRFKGYTKWMTQFLHGRK
jgi:hypothetical protein